MQSEQIFVGEIYEIELNGNIVPAQAEIVTPLIPYLFRNLKDGRFVRIYDRLRIIGFARHGTYPSKWVNFDAFQVACRARNTKYAEQVEQSAPQPDTGIATETDQDVQPFARNYLNSIPSEFD